MPQHKNSMEEFVFENSQGSDDPSIEQALINQYRAAQERKHREKQRKFLVAAESKLNVETNAMTDEIRNCMQRLETLYTNFVFQYAASEDRIRALWDKTRYLDERRIAALEDLQKAQVEQEEKAEEKQATGLSKVRTAYEDYTNIAQQLSP